MPSAIALKNGSSTLQSFTYSDSPAGTILSETDTPSSPQSPATYTYDSKRRVISMTPGTGSAMNYTFDASSNLTTLPAGASTGYDKAGELTSSTKSSTTTNYTYNADGQRLTATQGSTNVASGSWNGAGQLTSYDDPAADMVAATYDGTGLRASATTTAGTQDFVWGTTGQLPELLMDSTSAYIYSDGTAPAEQVNLSTGAITYLVSDSLGSVRGTVNSSGTVTGTCAYDAWGNPETSGGLSAETPFGYAGGYTDSTDLIYLLNRYYDPQTGQFISVDPAIGVTLAPYSYASGNPVSHSDPSGRCDWLCEGFALSASAIVGALCATLTAEDGMGWICWGLATGVYDAAAYWWDASNPSFWGVIYHFVRGFAIGAIFAAAAEIGVLLIGKVMDVIGWDSAAALLKRVASAIGHSDNDGKHAAKGLWFWIKGQL